MTAEDGLSDDEVRTSEYHSPPEEISDSEEEEEEVREKKVRRGNDSAKLSSRERVRSEKGKGGKRGSPKEIKPLAQPIDNTPTSTTDSVEERQRLASERHRSYSGVLSPVQESPEYARTPSTHGSAAGSADELEEDLNKALLHLDSETSGLKADAKEVEYIERAAKLSGSSHSGSPSPFPDDTPTTPNTVFWKKGKCVEISSTPNLKTVEKKAEDTQEREGEENKKEEEKGEREGEREGKGVDEQVADKVLKKREGLSEAGDEGEDFSAIPKVAPSLGLKEGHDRQQLAVARSSNRRRPPTRHTATQVCAYVHVHVLRRLIVRYNIIQCM